MKHNVDTTIIIPNYNGQKYIKNALDSLIEQTYQYFIVLVVDDGSSDQSIEIANNYKNRFPQLEVYQYKNVGITANWNRAIQLVKTEFFCLLHFDDELEPTYIEKMRQLCLHDSSIGIAHCAVTTIDHNSIASQSPIDQYKINRYFEKGTFCRSSKDEFKQLLSGSYINCPSVFYRKEAYDTIGTFNQTYKMVQDWEYWFRVILSDYKICGTREKLFRYRRHLTNESVKHSTNLIRYEEEFTLINWAFEQGAKRNLIDKNTKINYGLILKTVAMDISVDLRQAQVKDAQNKLNKIINLIPENQFALTILILKFCIHLKRPGGHLLYSIINGAIYFLRIFP